VRDMQTYERGLSHNRLIDGISGQMDARSRVLSIDRASAEISILCSLISYDF